MKLLDTVVFVSSLNPAANNHKTAISHMMSLRSSRDIFVPSSTLTELDLVLRNNGYTRSEIFETWQALGPLIGQKLAATTPTAHQMAAMLRLKGLAYFDSLITALALEKNAIVITKDTAMAKHVQTEW